MAETDMVLLGRYAASRDAEAFAELVRRYAGVVYGTCLRMLGSEADAEDVTQDCFLELARRAGKVRGAGDSVAGLVHAMARSRAIDFMKQASRRRKRERLAGRSPQTGSEWARIEPLVDAAMAELPEDQRELLVLHFLRGVTQAEMAQAAGMDQSTISRRLTRAVELLREKLAKQGVEVSAGALGAVMAEQIVRDVPAGVQASLGKMAMAGFGKAAGVGIGAKVAIAAVVAGVVGTGVIVAQQGSTTQTAATMPAAQAATRVAASAAEAVPAGAELVRNVRAAEAWFGRVKTFEAQFESVWRYKSGKVGSPVRSHLIFDEGRARYLREGVMSDGSPLYELRVWDGERMTALDRVGERLVCTIQSKAMFVGVGEPWMVEGRRLWFDAMRDQDLKYDFLGKPEEYEVVGRVVFHGVDCHVVQRGWEAYAQRLYVAVADGRAQGTGLYVLDGSNEAEVYDAVREMAAERGVALASVEDVKRWMMGRPRQQQPVLLAELHRRLWKIARAQSERWVEQYREIRPGCWAPTREFSASAGQLCETTIKRIAFDEAIDPKQFVAEIPEGTSVTDSTHNPPWEYSYKANRTPEEWKHIEQEANQRAAVTRP